MPEVQADESESDFMGRCVPQVLEDGTAEDQDQAVAICLSMWRGRSEKEAETQEQSSPLVAADIPAVEQAAPAAASETPQKPDPLAFTDRFMAELRHQKKVEE